MTSNPFSLDFGAEYVDAESRIHAVKSFSARECRAALDVPGLQKTVERAIAQRLKKLEKENA